MKITKLIIIFSFFMLMETLSVSCTIFCPCGCDSGPLKKMDILSWNVYTLDNSLQVVNPQMNIPFDQVFKSMQIGDRKLVFSEPRQDGSFFQNAYACSPAPMEAIQSFTSIKIIATESTTLANENDIINEGDDITDRLVMAFHHDSNFNSIPDFIRELKIYDTDWYLFRLKDKPANATTVKFNILITLSDGKIFEINNEILSVN